MKFDRLIEQGFMLLILSMKFYFSNFMVLHFFGNTILLFQLKRDLKC